MRELVWERSLPVAPDVAWPHLVVPEKMCAWSKAPITAVAEGDGGTPFGVGALRRVTMTALGRKSTFEEVIAESAPPGRFVYSVVRGLPLRDHVGVQTLVASPGGCRLVWRVRFDPLVSPLGAAASRMLDGQMNASLDDLQRVVTEKAETRRESARDGGAPRFSDDDEDVARLLERGHAIRDAQRSLADGLQGDAKYWFSRVYQYVTEEQLRFVGERATHRAWILRLLPVFHRFYTDNFDAFRRGNEPEAGWRVAFGAMERGHDGPSVLRGLLLGVRAHIEDDLPRALAEVWLAHYRGRCDYVRLRADYLRMAGIFRVASARLVAEMPTAWIPPQLRLIVRHAPLELQSWVFARNYYDVDRARRVAFERGASLARWLTDARRTTPG